MSNLVPILGVNRHRLLIDGEGVTTLVAFHGCPLHCKYCLNPQSLSDDFDFPLYSCEQLYERVKVDELYFLATRGGITFGGGEPCLRSEFINRFREGVEDYSRNVFKCTPEASGDSIACGR